MPEFGTCPRCGGRSAPGGLYCDTHAGNANHSRIGTISGGQTNTVDGVSYTTLYRYIDGVLHTADVPVGCTYVGIGVDVARDCKIDAIDHRAKTMRITWPDGSMTSEALPERYVTDDDLVWVRSHKP